MEIRDPDVHLPGEHALDHQIIGRFEGRWRLVGSRCGECAAVHYPPHEICPVDLAPCVDVPLTETGVLSEAVRVAIAPVGFAAPYWVAYVDLPENVRVFGILRWDGANHQGPALGATIHVGIEVVRHDPDVLGVIFTVKTD